jgi:hypothetical protein
MREAGTARPEYRELQENLELLAIAAGELEIALEANRRQPQTHAVLVRRSMHLHHAKEFSECVGTALSCLATIDQAVAQTPMALVMGTAAASRLGRAGDAERLMEAVRSKEAWGEYEYFGRFVLANEARDSETPVHLHALRDGLERFPSSRLLAANLFSNLNASAPEIAAEVVELAGRLRVVAELAQDDAYRLVDALLKLERWAESYCSPPAALSDHAVIGPRLSAASAGDRPRHRTPPPASQCCPPQYFGRHVRRVRRMFGEGQPQEPNPLETSRALFA